MQFDRKHTDKVRGSISSRVQRVEHGRNSAETVWLQHESAGNHYRSHQAILPQKGSRQSRSTSSTGNGSALSVQNSNNEPSDFKISQHCSVRGKNAVRQRKSSFVPSCSGIKISHECITRIRGDMLKTLSLCVVMLMNFCRTSTGFKKQERHVRTDTLTHTLERLLKIQTDHFYAEFLH